LAGELAMVSDRDRIVRDGTSPVAHRGAVAVGVCYRLRALTEANRAATPAEPAIKPTTPMMASPTQSHVSPPPPASPNPVCGAMTDGCGAGAMSSPGSGVLNGVGEAAPEVGLASADGDAAAVAVPVGSGVADGSWACAAVTVHTAANKVHTMATKTRVTVDTPFGMLRPSMLFCGMAEGYAPRCCRYCNGMLHTWQRAVP
jgi:hypothetical protein